MLGPIVLVVLFSFGSNALIGFPMGDLTLAWYRPAVPRPGLSRRATHQPCRRRQRRDRLHAHRHARGLCADARPPRLRQGALVLLSLPVLLPPLIVAIAIVVLFVRALGVGLGLPVVVIGHVLVTQPFVVARRDGSARAASTRRASTLRATSARRAGRRSASSPCRRSSAAIVGAALIAAALSLDDFIIASFTIGGGNTLSTFVWGKMSTTLDPSINAIATILLVLTVGTTALALRLTRYRG